MGQGVKSIACLARYLNLFVLLWSMVIVDVNKQSHLIQKKKNKKKIMNAYSCHYSVRSTITNIETLPSYFYISSYMKENPETYGKACFILFSIVQIKVCLSKLFTYFILNFVVFLNFVLTDNLSGSLTTDTLIT